MQTKNTGSHHTKMITIFLGVLMVVCVSCYQDVIDIDLSDIGSQVIIEGAITDQDGPYTVKITRRESQYKKGIYPPVEDAVVTMQDDAGHSEALIEVNPGIYKTHWMQGIPGRTYSLNVTVDGETYEAVSTMPRPVALDSVTYFRVSDPYVGVVAFPACHFTDPAGRDDFCRFNFFRNGELFDYEYTLYHGTYSDGDAVVMDDLNVVYYQNDQVRIEVLTIDEAMYEYWNTLNTIITGDNDQDDSEVAMFPVTLFNPTSNLSNNALGYFSAHTVRTYTFVVR